MATNDMYTPQDPTSQYPAPPFPPQQQSGPGDIHEMDPRPDHGESSYVGKGRLEGRKAEEGAQLARDAGRTVALIPGNLQDEEFNKTLVDQTVEQLGGLDILALIAGNMPTVDSVAEFETATLDTVLKTNIYPLFWTTRAALPHLKPGSSIITTSSEQAFQASPQLVEYAVSKAGILNWTRGMAGQLIEKGIRVNGVAPGPVWTPLQPAFVPNEKIESFGEQTPMKRPGQPAELAPPFVFLASQESSFVTGETIAVTGGTPLH